ncbi:Putative sortase-sorted surface protein [Acidipropionibacterium acidipropionici ATCC 4875]|uniref:Sortase-sorted surface protein n=2 Tax=Acidipropionibacterium acidipropionici TaxID=1748 RepID=K7SH70_ACIA4|nr:Putative sortase-sorted surface protein [Acidipropionibacterium acidipropionici ATCC 4875]
MTTSTSVHPSLWRRVLVGAVTAAAVAAAIIAPSAATAAGTVLASDSMSRVVNRGWGMAATGGSYSASPSTAGSVSGGTASLVSPAPGGTAAMSLNSVKALDAVSRIDVTLPTLPSGSSRAYIRHFLRGTSATSYATMLMVGPDGSSSVILERLRNGAETKFSEVPGPRLTAGKAFSLQISAVGTNPVRLGAKVWAAGAAEPSAWSALATDAAAERVTVAGPAGVTLYASKSGSVTPVRFDNLLTASTTTAPSYTPAPTPTPTPVLTDYPGQRLQAGAIAPGKQSYSVPATARYVATTGSDANTGTQASPFRTISAATKAAGAGGTVVVRGGVYHEQVLIYPHDRLTVEAYPGEAVWLDGSEPVSGWVRSGSVWVRSGWTSFFDASPTYTKGAPDSTVENWQWINAKYPMASHPDQIWVDGAALTQVASRDAVTAGTFYVDESADQLVMGTDPTGRKVEASTLAEAMSIRSKDSLIRGIGVRRYATSVPMMGTVSTYFSGVTLENVTIADNATTGLFIGATGASLKNVTVRNNGLMGIGGNKADGLTAHSVLSVGNNSQHFNTAPVSGAFKITTSRNITVTDSAFINNSGNGPWFDESVYNVTFTHNDVVGNLGTGLVFELSDRMIAADNTFINNGDDAVAIMNSGNATIWNNTIAGNGGGIDITQDSRRASDLSLPGHDKRQPLPDPTVPWIVTNVSVANNVVSQSAGEYLLRVADWSREFTGGQMISQSEGNLFHRASATTPTYVTVWSPQAGAGSKGYPTWDAYRAATGLDASSLLVTGASPLTSAYRLTSQYASRASSSLPVTAEVAAAAPRLTAGARVLGASTGD